jgi:hypothetical protein
MNKKYVVFDETNEFREMTDEDRSVLGTDASSTLDDVLILEEDEVEFLHGSCGDIQAIFAYAEGNETRIGIISEDKLLISANISDSCVTGLLNLLGRRHNSNMFRNK